MLCCQTLLGVSVSCHHNKRCFPLLRAHFLLGSRHAVMDVQDSPRSTLIGLLALFIAAVTEAGTVGPAWSPLISNPKLVPKVDTLKGVGVKSGPEKNGDLELPLTQPNPPNGIFFDSYGMTAPEMPDPSYGQGQWNRNSFRVHKHHYYPIKPQMRHEEEDQLIDKLFETLAGTTLVKIIAIIVVLKLFVAIFILAGVSAAGIKLSPIVLPLFLLPIGIAAVLVFVPLLIIALAGLALASQEGRRRRRRSLKFKSISSLHHKNVEEAFSRIPDLTKMRTFLAGDLQ